MLKLELKPDLLHLAIPEIKQFLYPKELKELSDRMLGFMKRHKGIGLAANQVRIYTRCFVMQVSGGRPYRIFNPKILAVSPSTSCLVEGCLSFPKEYFTITRPEKIDVSFQNWTGDTIYMTFSGLESHVYQHELDHLNGHTFHDRT